MHTIRGRVGAALITVVLASIGLSGVAEAAPAPAPTDTVWLCKPGVAPNPCEPKQDTTVVAADGTQSVEQFDSSTPPPVDCFYVYPTVTQQLAFNSDKTIAPEETFVAEQQAARFSRNCKVYAPMYRQSTIYALAQARSAGSNTSGDLAYGDVVSAWDDYMAHYNNGRGVVLIGHSQGSMMLRALIRNRIEPDPAEKKQMISAMLIGGNVLVAKGKDIGGDFASTPACSSPTQLGCVIAFSTFNTIPPADSVFGNSSSAGAPTVAGLPTGPAYDVLCTNPAALGSREPAPLHPVMRSGPLGALLIPAAVQAKTSFVTAPGSYTGQCISQNGSNVLLVTGGRGSLLPPLDQPAGLHLLDMSLAWDDLTDLVGTQSSAYLAR